jgi:hopanoid biosynthesis associated RND transporter like protein HpnN
VLTTSALTTCITWLVDFSRRRAWLVVILATIMACGLGCYAATHFKINTDINKLLSDHLDWRKREADLEKAFPQKNDLILIAIDGDTPDAAENAAAALYTKLQVMPERFTFVQRPDAIPFFQKNGILFLTKDEITGALSQMVEAQPLLGMLASDPSLRGFFGTIGLMLQGIQAGQVSYDQLDAPIGKIADTVEAAVAGQDRPLEWQSMAAGPKPTLRELRKFIIAKPVLNYGALEPGQEATTAIRNLAQELNLNADHGVHVRLTGPVPLNDEEFASVASGTGIATILSGVFVFVILLAALRSLRIVLPIIFTLIVGLIATTAFALAAVGSLNLISVAFAVMFIGIAVDFGIQFGVRYRDQHHIEPDHAKAMTRTASIIAIPLAMAGGSTTLGFLSFIPTAYRGVSELGLIAGVGMLIAFILNITLLPALLTLTRPPAEAEAIGFAWAAPIDDFIIRQRRAILIVAALLAVIALGITTKLHFDFDPLNLKDTHTESVSTLFDLMKDPDFNSYTVDILSPSLQDADALAAKLQTLPQVDHVMTLSSFVPEDQDAKLAMINDTGAILTPSLSLPALPPPSDAEIIDTIKKTADGLRPLADQHPTAARLAKALDGVIANPSKDVLDRLQHNLVDVLQAKLAMVKHALGAEHVSPETMTADLRSDWVTPDNRYLVEVYPKGNPRDHDTLVAFTDAVHNAAPDATGSPISIREGGRTVTDAFIQAGIYAIITIALLSFFILRCVRDVAIMLAPLFLAGILTLATIVVIGLPLNFANIIALPLLLSLGVSYGIYFVSYWRSGLNQPLQSSMARAVLFSAATVLIAFSSLALSSHPGTSGMGKLLTVALVYSLLCTFFVLPALCGPHKTDKP